MCKSTNSMIVYKRLPLPLIIIWILPQISKGKKNILCPTDRAFSYVEVNISIVYISSTIFFNKQKGANYYT